VTLISCKVHNNIEYEHGFLGNEVHWLHVTKSCDHKKKSVFCSNDCWLLENPQCLNCQETKPDNFE